MSYESVDALQKLLSEEVFHYASDKKKAAGRALGTIVEIITYYILRSWGLRDCVAIETRLPEFANPEISHNVEFSLHPIIATRSVEFDAVPPITAKKICRQTCITADDQLSSSKSTQLLSTDGLLRNSCSVLDVPIGSYVAHLDSFLDGKCCITLCLHDAHPYAVVECKRVGVEEGMKKGPQTIEKAKQGAYVASRVSSVQKIRLRDGTLGGVVEKVNGTLLYEKRYDDLRKRIMDSDVSELLRGFILTVGVVSNHGNWFTSGDQNKELKVLSQSYDWLIFLTDTGLVQFINDLLMDTVAELESARDAFQRSYSEGKTKNRFTKVRIDCEADEGMQAYFARNSEKVETWFNVIAPESQTLEVLRTELDALSRKDWRRIHSL